MEVPGNHPGLRGVRSLQTTQEAIERLGGLAVLLSTAGINSSKSFTAWKKTRANTFNDILCYPAQRRMPSATSLIHAHFHPKLPLIGFNYTQVAHNTLHKFPKGWTMPLRQCRGIVFDHAGKLVAKPFPKFFNLGEHPETVIDQLPDEPFSVLDKWDGHLGICFRYQGHSIITTRGTFTHRTAELAQEMLVDDDWVARLPDGHTALVEVIHPETQVHVDYQGRKGFVLIGAYRHDPLSDYVPSDLALLSKTLGIECVSSSPFASLSELQKLMKDRSIDGPEGYVVRFANGLRIKLKFETYIGKMVKAKLSHNYVIQRLLSNNLERMIRTLDEEVYAEALKMRKAVLHVSSLRQRKDETPHAFKRRRLQYLVDLAPPEKRTKTYRANAGKYLRHIAQ